MKLFKKLKINFCKKYKGRNWSNVVFTDNQAFIIIVQELVDGFLKGKIILCKEKYSKKVYVWGVFCLEFFEGNMNIQKYVSILENNINKIKEMFPKSGYCNEIMIKNINQMSHWNFIFKIK